MIQAPETLAELKALMRRPEFGAPLRFLRPDVGSLRDGVSLRAADLNGLVAQVCALSVLLPRGGVSGVRKARLRKGCSPEIGSLLRGYAQALDACPELGGEPARPVSELVAELVDRARRLARYQNLQYRSGRWVNQTLDLRLLLGALQWFLLSSVLQTVVARIEDPACPREEAERLRDRFSKLLLHRDRLSSDRAAGREAGKERRQALAQEIAELERRDRVQDVITALRHGRPVDQETLEQAARDYADIRGTDRAPGPTTERKTRR